MKSTIPAGLQQSSLAVATKPSIEMLICINNSFAKDLMNILKYSQSTTALAGSFRIVKSNLLFYSPRFPESKQFRELSCYS